MNIYLIGYRATGKTSVAKLLASILKRPFVDTDFELATRAGMTISDFVRKNGWESFRDMERSIVKQVSMTDGQVVATGGGVVLDPRNVSMMQSGGPLIWLKASAETIRTRLLHDHQSEQTRPALTPKGLIDEIETMLESRNPCYHRVKDFCIETDRLSITEICNQIVATLSENGIWDRARRFVANDDR